MVKKLHIHFSCIFKSSIWRILSGERWLVAETREGDTRSVNFAAIDLHQGRLLWEGLDMPQSWWVGASTVVANTLLLQLFSDPQKPQIKGMTAIDIPSGKLLWQHPQQSFVRHTAEGIIALQAGEDEPVFQLLDLATGEIKAQLEAAQAEEFPYMEAPAFLHPVHYTAENKYFSTIVLYLRQKLGVEPQKAVDYAEFQQMIIISYYIYEHKNLSNFLLVLDKEANVVLHEKLASHLPGVGLDTFFIVQHYLILVKDKKELIAYEL